MDAMITAKLLQAESVPLQERKLLMTKETLKRYTLFASIALAIIIYADTILRMDGVFLSFVDYSGHGFAGWLCLGFTCIWICLISGTTTLWVFRLTPGRKPNPVLFAAGMVFFVCFIAGIARHLPHPYVAEALIGAPAAILTYLSFFVKKA